MESHIISNFPKVDVKRSQMMEAVRLCLGDIYLQMTNAEANFVQTTFIKEKQIQP